MQHLTKNASDVYAETRRHQKEKKIQQTWTNGGRVIVKLLNNKVRSVVCKEELKSPHLNKFSIADQQHHICFFFCFKSIFCTHVICMYIENSGPCSLCCQPVRKNRKCIYYNICAVWVHLKCTNLATCNYNAIDN